jgi:hypothetical protein
LKKKIFNQPLLNWVTISTAFISLIISVRSCFLSAESIQISRNSYELNLAPILKIDFSSNISQRKYSIQFFNDGPIPIYDLTVRKELNFYADKGITFQSEKVVGKPWIYKNEFQPGDTFSHPIEFKDLEALYLGWTNKQLVLKDDKIIRTILFRISYKKKPDLKIFNERKYLFVEPINYFGDTTIFGFNPETYWASDFKNKLKIVESKENESSGESKLVYPY